MFFEIYTHGQNLLSNSCPFVISKRHVYCSNFCAFYYTEITRKEDKQGFIEVEDAAKRGGRVAGNARKETEKELGRPITSKENYLSEPEKKKKLEDKSKK